MSFRNRERWEHNSTHKYMLGIVLEDKEDEYQFYKPILIDDRICIIIPVDEALSLSKPENTSVLPFL